MTGSIVMLALLLAVTSLSQSAMGARSNEETFGYGVKLKTRGRLRTTTAEIHTNREEEFVNMTVARGDVTYETETIIDVQNRTIAFQNSSMDGCAVQQLPEHVTFEEVERVVKTPPRYRLGMEGLVCYLGDENVSHLIKHPEIQKLCGDDVEPFEIKACKPAPHNDRSEDVCIFSGYVYNAKNMTGGIYCIREIRKPEHIV